MAVLEAYEKWGPLAAVIFAVTAAVPERESRFQEIAYSFPVPRWVNLLEKLGVAFGTYLVLAFVGALLLKTGYKDLAAGKLLFYAIPPAWALVTLALFGAIISGHALGGAGTALGVWLFNYYAGYRFTRLTFLFLASSPVENVDLILNRSLLMTLGGCFLTLALITLYLDCNQVRFLRILKVFALRFWSDLPRWGEEGRKVLLLLAGLFFIAPLLYSAVRPIEISDIRVDCTVVRDREIRDTIKASGELLPAAPIIVRAPAAGNLSEITVKPGDWVKQGQVWACYDNEDLLAQEEDLKRELAVANDKLKKLNEPDSSTAEERRLTLEGFAANLASAQDKVTVSEQLYNIGDIPRTELEGAQQELANAQREYQKAKLQKNGPTTEIDNVRRTVADTAAKLAKVRSAIENRLLSAPENGQVLKLDVLSGQTVAKGTPVMLLRSNNKLKAQVSVAPEAAGKLRPGQQALVKVGEEGLEYRGQVSGIGVMTENTSEGKPGVPVEILLEKDNSGLRPGTPVLAVFDAGSRKILAVPKEAVRRSGEKETVWVISKEKVFSRQIYTGLGDEKYFAVLDGLEPGETVVIDPPKKLAEGKRVYEKVLAPEDTLVSIKKKEKAQ